MDDLSDLANDVSSYASAMDGLRIIRSFMQEKGLSYEDAHEAAYAAYGLGYDRAVKVTLEHSK